jgi:hypothetical protein
MPITYSIPIGPVVMLLANVVYALPGKKVTMFADGATPTMVQSNDVVMTTTVPVVFTNGQAELAGAFIRATADSKVRVVGD